MMPINLLPHRQQARQRQYQRWLLESALVLAVAGLCCVVWSMALYGAVTQAEAAQQVLQTAVADLEGRYAEVQKLEAQLQSWQQRQQMVEGWQQQRQAGVQLLQALPNALPDGVYWNSLKQEGERLTLSGTAQSQERISAILRDLNAQPHGFREAHLEEIVATDVQVPQRGTHKWFKFVVTALWLPAQEQAAHAGDFQ